MKNSIYEHAVIIGIDGMGNFNRLADTPNMDRIFKRGAVCDFALSMYPTVSAQNWGAMLLGVDPEIHGLTNAVVSSQHYCSKAIPSLFLRVREKYPGAYLASCSNWNPINYGIIEQDIGVDFHTDDKDENLCCMIEKCIEKKPKLLFVQFDECDGAGHSFGYGTENHLRQIEKTDTLVGRIYEAYEKAGIIKDTLFTVIADHGGDEHSHGSYTDGEKYIYFAAAGKTVKETKIEYATAKDINSVILHGLGIDIPEYNKSLYSSQIPAGFFTDYDGEYVRSTSVTFSPENVPTPGLYSDKGLLHYFDRDEIKFALFFDNNTEDAVSKAIFEQAGSVKFYSTGVHGSTGELGYTGWLTSSDVKFGRDSFSAGFWFRLDKSLTHRCYVFGTKAMRTDSRGFMFCINNYGSDFCIETDDHSTYEEFSSSLTGFEGGWVHTLFTLDRMDMSLKIYHNFKLSTSFHLSDTYNINLDNLPFTVGNECSFRGNNEFYRNLFNLDDLIVFNKALSENEVAGLAEYYGIA